MSSGFLLPDFGSLDILPAQNQTKQVGKHTKSADSSTGPEQTNYRGENKNKKTKKKGKLSIVIKVSLTWEPTKNCFAFPQRELVSEPCHYVLAPGVARTTAASLHSFLCVSL